MEKNPCALEKQPILQFTKKHRCYDTYDNQWRRDQKMQSSPIMISKGVLLSADHPCLKHAQSYIHTDRLAQEHTKMEDENRHSCIQDRNRAIAKSFDTSKPP